MSELKIDATNVNDYADVLNEMIKNLAIETEKHTTIIIENVAKYYNIPSKQIIKALKNINSDFTKNNNIVYYFQGKAIKRTAYTEARLRIIKKIGKKASVVFKETEDATTKFIESIKLILENDIDFQHI